MLYCIGNMNGKKSLLIVVFIVTSFVCMAKDWRFVFPGLVLDVAAADSTYYMLCDNRIVYAVSQNGDILWQKSILFKPAGTIQYNSAGFLLVPFENGYIYGLSEAGRELFVLQDIGSDFSIYMLPGGLFIIHADNALWLYNQFGKLLSSIQPDDYKRLSHIYKNGTISYFNTSNEKKFMNIFGYGISNAVINAPEPDFLLSRSHNNNNVLAFNDDFYFYRADDSFIIEDIEAGTKSYAVTDYTPVAYSLGNQHLLIAYDNWLVEGRDMTKLEGYRYSTARGDRSNGNVFHMPENNAPSMYQDRKYEILMTMARSKEESVKNELLDILFTRYEDKELSVVIPYLNDVLQHLVLEFIDSLSVNVAHTAVNMPEIRKKAWRFAEYAGFGIGRSAFFTAARYEHDEQVLYSMLVAASAVLTYQECFDLYQLILRRKPDSEIVLFGVLRGCMYLRDTRGQIPDFVVSKGSSIITGTYSRALQELAFDLLKM